MILVAVQAAGERVLELGTVAADNIVPELGRIRTIQAVVFKEKTEIAVAMKLPKTTLVLVEMPPRW